MSFLKASGHLADKPSSVYQKADIPGIVRRMLASTNMTTRGTRKLLGNTRYLLRRIGFFGKVVNEFQPSKPNSR